MKRIAGNLKTRVLACAVLAVGTGMSLAGTPAAPSSAVGERLPAFELAMLDGSRFSSRELAGKVAVIDLWSTWCGPCLKDIPHLNELSRHYKNEEFAVVGITLPRFLIGSPFAIPHRRVHFAGPRPADVSQHVLGPVLPPQQFARGGKPTNLACYCAPLPPLR